MRRSNRRFALLALSALSPVTVYGTGDLKVLQSRQLYVGKRRYRAIARILRQGGLSFRALWGLLLVLHRALVDFVALPKTGRIGAEAKPTAEPIQSIAAQKAAPVKRVTENSLPEVSTEQCPQPSEPSVKEPISGRKPKRSKHRNQKADRAAKLETALKLLGEGQSRRAVAKTLGIAESTLRAWLKSERVACVPS
jgi:hypothetical protein